jgi:hypothetical protein
MADDSLAAFMDVNMLDGHFLPPLASAAVVEGLEERCIGAGELVSKLKLHVSGLEWSGPLSIARLKHSMAAEWHATI